MKALTAKHVRPLSVLVVAALAFSLGGCGNGAKTSEQKGVIADCADYNLSSHGFGECELKLHDGRHVACVIMSGYRKGGLSCDWEHASKTKQDTK